MGIATNFSNFGSQVVYRPVDIIGSEIPHCAHIYVSWSYVWKYTNVKVTFLSIKTICRALSLLVLKILAVYWDTRY